jgi:hypothetical protein
MASIARGALAGTTASTAANVTAGATELPEEFAVGNRYVVPHLPADVVERLPAAERGGDRYLAERIALAELVIGERILAAEDLANDYAHELPGFTEVLLVDGFSQDADGTWFYDRYGSWMRFPLMASAVCWPSVPSRCDGVGCC